MYGLLLTFHGPRKDKVLCLTSHGPCLDAVLFLKSHWSRQDVVLLLHLGSHIQMLFYYFISGATSRCSFISQILLATLGGSFVTHTYTFQVNGAVIRGKQSRPCNRYSDSGMAKFTPESAGQVPLGRRQTSLVTARQSKTSYPRDLARNLAFCHFVESH